ncbi:hypothetical protein DXG01_009253 [Tephrocybe rancida]|nr:hypothetical protein DXG01_009253 [Tephrocybe rancida]
MDSRKVPNVQPTDLDESRTNSNSSTESLKRTMRQRPPTPLFPSALPPRSSVSVSQARDTDIRKGKSRGSNRPAYTHYSPRSRDDNMVEDYPRLSSRSRPSSSTQALMRLLTLETARADTAEKRLDKDNEAILKRVRNIHEAHMRAEAELVKANTELAMYKVELDLAQKEILRAQTIINEVERARAEAEERGVKDRERVRELILQRAVDEAREEGRREGWRLGLERGRWDMQNDSDLRSLVGSERTANRRKTASRDTLSSTSSASSTRDENGSRYAQNELPAPLAITASVPKRPDSSPEPPSSHSSEHITEATTTRSETRSSGPAPSRRSRKSRYSVPPDGFIPTLGTDAHIALPPPHEFATPLGPSQPLTKLSRSDHSHVRAARSIESKGQALDSRDIPTSRNDKSIKYHTSSSLPLPPHRGVRDQDHITTLEVKHGDSQDTPALSTVSTRISQLDIVGPPSDSLLNSQEERHPVEAQRRRRQMNIYGPQTALKDGPREGIAQDRQGATQTPSTASHTRGRPENPTSPRAAHRSSYIYRTSEVRDSQTDTHTMPSNQEPRATVQRSFSSVTVPGIDVEPPSRSPTISSPATALDPVLLTPDDASHSLALPLVVEPRHNQHVASPVPYSVHQPIAVDKLPLGFVPISPGFNSGSKPLEPNAQVRRQIYSGTALKEPSQLDEWKMETSQGLDYSPAPLNRPFSIFSDV